MCYTVKSPRLRAFYYDRAKSKYPVDVFCSKLKNSIIDIMELFKTLNEAGRTVVIVTHDMNVAEQCGRIIEISDGEIVSE